MSTSRPYRLRNHLSRCLASYALILAGMLGSTVAHGYTMTASPTTCTSVAGIGTVAWTSPGNATTSDNVYASASNVIRNTTTNYLECTGFNFSLPSGATINGITVYVERKTNGGTIRDAAMRIIKGGVIGTTDLSTTTNYTTADVVEAHGGSTNLWGTTWTAADINATTFGAAFAAKNTSTTSTTNRTVTVDQIYIVVDFSSTTLPPGTWSATNNPGACTSVAGIGTIAWASPGNALASDNVYATASNVIRNTTTNYLECTNYGFNIPTGATINGITVNVERKTSGGTIRDAAMRIVKGGVIGTTDLSTTTNYTTADVIEAHGGTTNLWGTTWTAADINATNFGAAFAAKNTSTTSTTNRTVSVDHMPVTVTFTIPAVVNPGDFNIYDTSTTPAAALDGMIKTKVAGQSFTLDIAALNTAKTGLLTSYTQTVKVELLNASSGGTLDANSCNSGWTLIQQLPNQTFTSGDAGRHTISGIVENNAWANVAVRVSYPATGTATAIGCSTDHFAIRPNVFSLSVTDNDWQSAGTLRTLNNTSASGGTLHKAGQPFTISASAYNAAATPAVTTNYSGTPGVATCVYDATAGVNVCSTNDLLPAGTQACSGTACTGTPASIVLSNASSGQISTGATYDEVGSFSLQLQDRSFAAIDATDGTPQDCSTSGAYICSGVSSVGRFVPDHYVLSFPPTLGQLLNRRDLASHDPATTGDVDPAVDAYTLTVVNPSGFASGDKVLVSGADAGGADLVTAITVSGSTFTLSAPASTAVTGAWVQKLGTYTAGSVSAGSSSLIVSGTSGFASGDAVVVDGAGTGGNDLATTLSAVSGNTLTLATPAATGVAGALVRKVGFTYMDETLALNFTITAEDATNETMQNYEGALARLDVTSPVALNFAAADGTNYFTTANRLALVSSNAWDGSSAAWSNGTVNLTVVLGLSSLPNAASPRTGTADGPYHNLYFGIAPSDQDGVTLLSANYDLNTDAVAGYDHQKLNYAPARLRMGQLKLGNAHGSEKMDLPMPLEAQYWNGTAFVTNIDDSSTVLSTGIFSLGGYIGGITATNIDTPTGSHVTLGSGGKLASGRGTLTLLKPNPTPSTAGSVDVTANLSGIAYLKKCSATSCNNNAAARATFGVYKGNNSFIYLRETY